MALLIWPACESAYPNRVISWPHKEDCCTDNSVAQWGEAGEASWFRVGLHWIVTRPRTQGAQGAQPQSYAHCAHNQELFLWLLNSFTEQWKTFFDLVLRLNWHINCANMAHSATAQLQSQQSGSRESFLALSYLKPHHTEHKTVRAGFNLVFASLCFSLILSWS